MGIFLSTPVNNIIFDNIKHRNYKYVVDYLVSNNDIWALHKILDYIIKNDDIIALKTIEPYLSKFNTYIFHNQYLWTQFYFNLLVLAITYNSCKIVKYFIDKQYFNLEDTCYAINDIKYNLYEYLSAYPSSSKINNIIFDHINTYSHNFV